MYLSVSGGLTLSHPAQGQAACPLDYYGIHSLFFKERRSQGGEAAVANNSLNQIYDFSKRSVSS